MAEDILLIDTGQCGERFVDGNEAEIAVEDEERDRGGFKEG